jgi:hypothetical protein
MRLRPLIAGALGLVLSGVWLFLLTAQIPRYLAATQVLGAPREPGAGFVFLFFSYAGAGALLLVPTVLASIGLLLGYARAREILLICVQLSFAVGGLAALVYCGSFIEDVLTTSRIWIGAGLALQSIAIGMNLVLSGLVFRVLGSRDPKAG